MLDIFVVLYVFIIICMFKELQVCLENLNYKYRQTIILEKKLSSNLKY